jgi:hypothetical protein
MSGALSVALPSAQSVTDNANLAFSGNAALAAGNQLGYNMQQVQAGNAAIQQQAAAALAASMAAQQQVVAAQLAANQALEAHMHQLAADTMNAAQGGIHAEVNNPSPMPDVAPPPAEQPAPPADTPAPQAQPDLLSMSTSFSPPLDLSQSPASPPPVEVAPPPPPAPPVIALVPPAPPAPVEVPMQLAEAPPTVLPPSPPPIQFQAPLQLDSNQFADAGKAVADESQQTQNLGSVDLTATNDTPQLLPERTEEVTVASNAGLDPNAANTTMAIVDPNAAAKAAGNESPDMVVQNDFQNGTLPLEGDGPEGSSGAPPDVGPKIAEQTPTPGSRVDMSATNAVANMSIPEFSDKFVVASIENKTPTPGEEAQDPQKTIDDFGNDTTTEPNAAPQAPDNTTPTLGGGNTGENTEVAQQPLDTTVLDEGTGELDPNQQIFADLTPSQMGTPLALGPEDRHDEDTQATGMFDAGGLNSLNKSPTVQSVASTAVQTTLDGSTVPYTPISGWFAGMVGALTVASGIDAVANMANTPAGGNMADVTQALDGMVAPDLNAGTDQSPFLVTPGEASGITPESLGIRPPNGPDIARLTGSTASGILASGYELGGLAGGAPAWVAASAAASAGGLLTQEGIAQMARVVDASSPETNMAAGQASDGMFAGGDQPDASQMVDNTNVDVTKLAGDPSIPSIVGSVSGAATNTGARLLNGTSRLAGVASTGSQFVLNQMAKDGVPNPDALNASADGMTAPLVPTDNNTTDFNFQNQPPEVQSVTPTDRPLTIDTDNFDPNRVSNPDVKPVGEATPLNAPSTFWQTLPDFVPSDGVALPSLTTSDASSGSDGSTVDLASLSDSDPSVLNTSDQMQFAQDDTGSGSDVLQVVASGDAFAQDDQSAFASLTDGSQDVASADIVPFMPSSDELAVDPQTTKLAAAGNMDNLDSSQTPLFNPDDMLQQAA